MLLKDAAIYPTDDVLKNALGSRIYEVLTSFFGTIADDGMAVEWRFYNDGKAWLGKVTHRKKTVLWLSVWDGFFRTAFYFTEKHLESVAALEISERIKSDFVSAKPVGRLIPMVVDVHNEEQLADLITVARFKNNVK